MAAPAPRAPLDLETGTTAPSTPVRPPATPRGLRPDEWLHRGAYWLVPVLASFAVVLWHIGRPQLWRDELFTWVRSTMSLGEIYQVIHEVDSVFVPYYIAMHGWTAVAGTSVIALRLPSAVAMTIAAGVIAVLGKRLFGPLAGLVAGLLFALIPATSRFGQEAKPHIFALLFVALSTLLLLRALERPHWSRWSLYALTCSLIGFSHLLAYVAVFAHGVAVLALHWRDRRILISALGAVAVSTIPVGLLAAAGYANKDGMAWLPLTTQQTLYDFPVKLFSASIFHISGDGLFAGIVLALAVVAISVLGRRAAVPAILAVVPPVVLIAAGSVQHVYHPRYLLYTLVGWILLAAAYAVRLRPAVTIGLGLVLGFLALPGQLTERQPNGHGDYGVEAMAGIMATRAHTGDAVMYQVSAGDWLSVGTAYYLPRAPQHAAGAPHTEHDLRRVECTGMTTCSVPSGPLWVLCMGKHTTLAECLSPADLAAAERAHPGATPALIRDYRFTILRLG
ncbi:MAG: mannosyltransferase [Cryptosporangiaceae bacterium]|nr:mannosyltransferase [Cryptosporangiaceae bacterium]